MRNIKSIFSYCALALLLLVTPLFVFAKPVVNVLMVSGYNVDKPMRFCVNILKPRPYKGEEHDGHLRGTYLSFMLPSSYDPNPAPIRFVVDSNETDELLAKFIPDCDGHRGFSSCFIDPKRQNTSITLTHDGNDFSCLKF